jgi:hypothetical protein
VFAGAIVFLWHGYYVARVHFNSPGKGKPTPLLAYKKSVAHLDFGNSNNNDAYGNYVAVCVWNDVNRDVHQNNVRYCKVQDLSMTYLSYRLAITN